MDSLCFPPSSTCLGNTGSPRSTSPPAGKALDSANWQALFVAVCRWDTQYPGTTVRWTALNTFLYMSTDITGQFLIHSTCTICATSPKRSFNTCEVWPICILQIRTNPRNPACTSYATQKAQHAASRSFLWYLVILQDTYGFKDVWSALSTTIFCPYYHLSGA